MDEAGSTVGRPCTPVTNDKRSTGHGNARSNAHSPYSHGSQIDPPAKKYKRTSYDISSLIKIEPSPPKEDKNTKRHNDPEPRIRPKQCEDDISFSGTHQYNKEELMSKKISPSSTHHHHHYHHHFFRHHQIALASETARKLKSQNLDVAMSRQNAYNTPSSSPVSLSPSSNRHRLSHSIKHTEEFRIKKPMTSSMPTRHPMDEVGLQAGGAS